MDLSRFSCLSAFAMAIALVATQVCSPLGAQVRASSTPYDLHAILPLSGPGAFLGTHIAKSYEIIEKLVNKSGGIHGRPLRFVIADDGTSPQTAVQLAAPLIAANVPVFLGPSIGGPCGAVAALVAKSATVQYCLSPLIHPAPGSFVFSAMVSSADLWKAQVRYFRERGWTRLAAISSTDASGADFETGLNAALALPENSTVTLVAREHFNPTDLTVSAQLNRIKAATPQAVLVLTTGTPFGTVLEAVRDIGVSVPIGAANSNMIPPQLEQYKAFMPGDLYFAGFRSLVEGAARPGPIRDLQKTYFDAFRAANVTPDIGHDVAWDATMIVIDALRHLPSDCTGEQVRNYIASLQGWTGINGVYNFRDGSQRGIGSDALVIDRYDATAKRFVPVSRPGGYLR
jgi:branched-chain amino acid transport system substrate-binding protein